MTNLLRYFNTYSMLYKYLDKSGIIMEFLNYRKNLLIQVKFYQYSYYIL